MAIAAGSKVLVVDDEKDIVESLHAFLTKQGFQVIDAYDGQEGYQKTKSEQPNIVIMDLGMAPTSGFEACKLIRMDHKTKHIPILVLTAAGMTFEKIEKALGSGADGYLDKPFKHELLLTKIEGLLTRSDPSVKVKERRAKA